FGRCSGTEKHLEAGVSCGSKLFSDPKPDNQIRLKYQTYGQLQVQGSLGEWFPVCGTNWTTEASQVVCKQLGFKAHYGFTLKPYEIYGDYRIITNLNCNGREKTLGDCYYTKWTALYGRASPWHKTQALECGSIGIQISCVDTATRPRLVGGQSNTAGQLEIWYENKWRKVCLFKEGTIHASYNKI
ncbi:unnamed protein product, partial [Owenia fusiformis]